MSCTAYAAYSAADPSASAAPGASCDSPWARALDRARGSTTIATPANERQTAATLTAVSRSPSRAAESTSVISPDVDESSVTTVTDVSSSPRLNVRLRQNHSAPSRAAT